MAAIAAPAFAGGNEGTSASETYNKQSFDKEILSQRLPYAADEEKVFSAGEWQIDLFGTYADTAQSPRYRDGFGGGLGVNHFWTENWGAGLEGYWWEARGDNHWLNNAGANLIYRIPFEELRLAPYAFIGPGGHFNGESEASGHVGGGLEWRFMDGVGAFADARYHFTTGPDDFALFRTGIKFVF